MHKTVGYCTTIWYGSIVLRF